MTTGTKSTETQKKYPAPVYAAAGAGDLAYRQLRKLPGKVAELRGRVGGTDVDVDRLRGAARRNAQAFVTGAQAAQERAQALYADLVARGEQVVRGGRRAAQKAAAELESAEAKADQAKPARKTAKAAAK